MKKVLSFTLMLLFKLLILAFCSLSILCALGAGITGDASKGGFDILWN